MQTPTGEKESRYWPWEIPIAFLLVVGTLILAIGIPVIILPHSDWATLLIGLAEAFAGVLVFAAGRPNAVRGTGMALFLAGAVAFVAVLGSIVSSSGPSISY